jgi:hypothetical protein
LPFRDAEQHLRDILESINNIDAFLGDMNFDVYRGDLKTKSAVEQQMQIITEAAVRNGGPMWASPRATYVTSLAASRAEYQLPLLFRLPSPTRRLLS